MAASVANPDSSPNSALNAAANPAVLSVEGLSKTYMSFKKEPGLIGGLKALVHRQKFAIPAVKPLNFTIERGEFIGLLGPNGAGKTTTLKMLTGLIRPSTGRALAFGQFDTALRPPAYLRRIGMVMGQRNQLNPDLPAMDSFRLAQAIYGLSEERCKKRIAMCEEIFGVSGLVLTPVRKLSLGERMKMELMLAILHEPELLFLDEPTIGLDFAAARQIRAFLGEANKRLGITVVLTSHYPKDIEELCRRVVLINHGSIVYDGLLAGMDERLQTQKVVSLVFRDAGAAAQARTAALALQQAGLPLSLPVAGVGTAGEGENARQLNFDAPLKDTAKVLAQLLARLDPQSIVDVKVGERPLEEIFNEIYQQSALADAALARTTGG